MSESGSGRADWKGVGTAFQRLGDRLKGHADQTGQALKSGSDPAAPVASRVESAFKTVVAHFDQAVADPELRESARTASGSLVDAVKDEIRPTPTPPATADDATDEEPPGDKPGPALPA